MMLPQVTMPMGSSLGHVTNLDLSDLFLDIYHFYTKALLNCSQIDEKVFDYLLVNLRDVILNKMLEEDEKRNDLIEAGFACEKLRGEELFDFLEECAKESNTYVRYCSTEEEELTRKLSELELAKKVSELE